MATVQEVIRRLSIESTSKGVEENVRKLRELEKSYQGVTVEGKKTEGATQSMERRFASIQRQYDSNFRAVQALSKVERDLSTAMGQGLLSLERKNELLALAARRYVDTATAAQAAAAAEAAAARARVNSAASVNQRLGVRDDFGAAARGADIAAYGRELDSLRAKYNPLFAAGQQYRATLAEINMAARVGALTERERAAAINVTKTAFAGQVQAINAAGNAYTMAGRRAGAFGGSLGQLSFQINDIASGLLMGQSPFMIMAQQGGQVFQIWQMNNNIFKELKDTILGLLTPGRAIVLGFLAASAAAYGLYRVLNTEGQSAEKTIEEQERLVGLLKKAYSDAAGDVKRFNKEVSSGLLLQAQQNILTLQNQLVEFSRTLEKQFTTPTSVPGEIPSVPGVAQIDNARIVSSRYREFGTQLETFFSTIQQGGPQTEKAVRELENAIGDLGRAHPELAERGVALLRQLQPLLDHLAKIKEIRDAVNPPHKPTRDERRAERDAEREAEFLRKASEQRATAVNMLHVERDALFMTEEAAMRLRMQEEELAKLRERGIHATPQLVAEIEAWAESYASIAEENRKLGEVIDLYRDTFKGFWTDVASGIREGKDEWQSFADAGINALNRLADRLLDMMLDQAFNAVLGGFGGMGGGQRNPWMAPRPGGLLGGAIIPGILHGGGMVGSAPSSGRYIHPAYYDDAPRYHGGGVIGPRERLIITEEDEEVLTRRDPRHRWNGGGNAAPSRDLNIKLINEGGQPMQLVSQRQTEDGDVEVTMRAVARDEMARPSGGNVLNQGYGVRPRLRTRG